MFSCGGQWAAFQVIAWGNMIREYSQMVPLSTAVEMTFSGEYPCPICKAISEKQQREKEKALEIGKDKQKFFVKETAASAPRLAAAPSDYPVLRQGLVLRSEPPPVPPPRCV